MNEIIMKENRWGFEVGDIVKLIDDEMEFRGEFDGKFYAEFLEEYGYGVTQDFIPKKHTGRYWDVCENETWTLVRKAKKPQREFRVGDRVKVIKVIDKGIDPKYLGKIGTINKISSGWIEFEENNICCMRAEQLELVADEEREIKVGQIWESLGLANPEFMGSRIKIIQVSGDSIVSTKATKSNCIYWTEDYLLKEFKLVEEEEQVCNNGYIGELVGVEIYKNNVESPTTIKKGQSIMSKLTNFVKDSLLSKEEKLMRKHGLKDSCGDYTSEARELAIQKLMSECDSYFIEVVKDMEAEEKANK